ncbi:MAG: hypothetical protein KKG93_13085 [Bacteroidetes bacterium]|nr:hypothetical protein [Bacteroidota bacterium]
MRTNITHYSAIVWERDDIGHAEKNDLTLEIKVSINSLIDEFIKDYYKVNKKRK